MSSTNTKVFLAMLIFVLVTPVSSADFKAFYNIGGYKPGPELKQGKILKLEIASGDNLWGKKPATNKNLIWPPNEPSADDERRIRDLAKTWAENKTDIICLDIEHWPVNGNDAVVFKNIKNFEKVLSWIRQEAPDLKIGLYGVLPVRDINRALKDPNSNTYKDWQVVNNRLLPLGQMVDVIFPSLYTITTDPEKWKTFAIADLNEAAKYGKPVYAFLWARYHDSIPKLGQTFLPEPFWEMELQTVKEHADGAVIWDYSLNKPWDDQVAWWKSVKLMLIGK